MTTRKTWTADEKFQIVLEGLQPRANVSEICRRHGISSTAYYEWRERALASMKGGLRSKEGTPDTALRHENARLKKLVADFAIANDVLREHLEGSREKNDGGSS
ncbi:MAG: transposase [Thermoplasmata archaeon]